MNASITTRVPQNDDSVSMLLARSLSGSVAGSGLTSASRTATTSTTSQAPSGFSTVTALMYISAAGAAGGLTLRIEAQDPDGNWYVLAQDVAARSAPILTGLQVSKYPIQSGSASIPGSPAINGRSWDINAFPFVRATVNHSTADAYTYKLSFVFS